METSNEKVINIIKSKLVVQENLAEEDKEKLAKEIVELVLCRTARKLSDEGFIHSNGVLKFFIEIMGELI